jgi:methionine-rich copper-binding protein CopC
VALSWAPVTSPNVTGIRICRADGSVAPSSPTCAGAVNRVGTAIGYTDTSALAGRTYSYAVWTYGAGPIYSARVSVPTSTVPGAIGSVTPAVSPTQVTLTWTTPVEPNITGVRLCRVNGSTPLTSPSCTPLADPATSPYVDTGLVPGTTYSYSLWTHDAKPTYSAAFGATVTTTANPVTGQTIAAAADGVHLAWTNPGDPTFTGVKICRTTGATAPTDSTSCTQVADVAKPAISFTDVTAAGGTTYSYALFAHDGTVFAPGQPLTVNTIPDPVSAASATAVTGGVQVSWTNPSDPNFVGVKVCRTDGATAAPDPVACTALVDQATPFVDATAQSGTTYRYWLWAHDAQPQYSTVTNVLITTTVAPVTGLSATASASQVQLSWTNPSEPNFVGVKICRADGTVAPPDPTACTALADTASSPYVDTSVQPGSTYSYALWAHDGQPTYSAAAATVTVTTPANPVTGVSATPQNDGVHLAWTNPADTGLTGVRICRATGTTPPSDPTTCTQLSDAAGTSFVDSTAQAGTTYSYALFAHDGTVFAAPATVTTSTAPNPITGLSATATHSQVQLSWTNPADPDFAGVRVCRADGTAAPSNPSCPGLTPVDVTGTTYTDTTVRPGNTYSYALWTFDAGRTYSVAVTVTAST